MFLNGEMTTFCISARVNSCRSFQWWSALACSRFWSWSYLTLSRLRSRLRWEFSTICLFFSTSRRLLEAIICSFLYLSSLTLTASVLFLFLLSWAITLIFLRSYLMRLACRVTLICRVLAMSLRSWVKLQIPIEASSFRWSFCCEFQSSFGICLWLFLPFVSCVLGLLPCSSCDCWGWKSLTSPIVFVLWAGWLRSWSRWRVQGLRGR